MDAEPEHAARRRRMAPGRRIGAVERAALDVEPPAGVERDRRQAERRRAPARRDRSGRSRGHPDVNAWIMPVLRSATNNWRVTGSNARPPSAGPGFGAPSSVTLANGVIAPVAPSIRQIVPGPPSAIEAEQARHEGSVGRAAPRAVGLAVAVGVRHHDRQAVCRGRGGIDVRRPRVVERDGEHLADLAGADGEKLWRRHRLRPRRAAEAAGVDDAQHRAFGIDRGLVGGVGAGRQCRRAQRCARETGNDSEARRKDRQIGGLRVRLRPRPRQGEWQSEPT